MIIPDKLYSILKWLCLIFLPAISVLYMTLSKIWGFPYSAEISGTISAICVFIGAIIGISTIGYNTKKVGELENGKSNND